MEFPQRHSTGSSPAQGSPLVRFVLTRATVHSEDLDALTERVIGAGIAVHRELGPGLLESIYRECLSIELSAQRLRVEAEPRFGVRYRDHWVGGDLRLDLLVDGCLVVEVKAVDYLHPVHSAQVITYLKLTGCPAGLLMNFNVASLRAGLKRLQHPSLYRRVPGVEMPERS